MSLEKVFDVHLKNKGFLLGMKLIHVIGSI